MEIEKIKQFILEQNARTAALQAKAREHLDAIDESPERFADRSDRLLDRVEQLLIREAREERRRRQELRRHGNGNQ